MLDSSKKILLVDGARSDLQGLADSFQEDGCAVIHARSAAEAIERLAADRVDCVLVDWSLPGTVSEETCRRIKSLSSAGAVPVIMLSPREDRDGVLRSLDAGADDFMVTSSDLEVQRARVAAHVRRRHIEDERRAAHEQLLRSEHDAERTRLIEDLERKSQELGSFSHSVSHDLRAPLRAIDGFSQALLEDYTSELDAQGKDYLHRVRNGAHRMGALIDALLSLSRVTLRTMERERVDLSQLATSVADKLRATEPERDVHFVIATGLEALGDRDLLRVLVENLLGNAWKFTSRLTTSARIEVGRDGAATEHAFFVGDNGAGFDMAYSDKLFAPFQRLHGSSDFAGTGVGLAAVQRIVGRHGGRVWAEGAVGAGATIHFTLPEPVMRPDQ